jgi:ATP-dependent helicase HrpB
MAALVTESVRRGAGEAGCQAAALLSAGVRGKQPSDLLHALDAGLDGGAQRVYQQLIRLVRPRRGTHSDEGLLHAVLRAYPDRVRKGKDGRWMVALDVEERRERGEPLVRLFAPIEPEWLIDVFPDRITESDALEWNRAAERVEQVSALVYDGMVISESRGAPEDAEAAARILAEKALEVGLHRFTDMEELDALRRRVEFAARHCALRPLDDETLRRAFGEYARGSRSFGELGKEGFLEYLVSAMPAGDRKLLDEVAPDRVRLASGRQARVRYEAGKPPVVASRLQDFFGMKETPRAARGQTPMVVELLAPNRRPVQTTTDLAGFWERLYPQVRRELMRRYPRHSWPEKPV